jgi:hypothetical protein
MIYGFKLGRPSPICLVAEPFRAVFFNQDNHIHDVPDNEHTTTLFLVKESERITKELAAIRETLFDVFQFRPSNSATTGLFAVIPRTSAKSVALSAGQNPYGI